MFGKKIKKVAGFETVINNNEYEFQNLLDFFPIGLIVLEKDFDCNEYRIRRVNSYVLKLLDLPKNLDIKIFKQRIEGFKQWENSHLSEINLKTIIFEYEEHHKFQAGTFISTLSMIYVKIKKVKKTIFICIDNYNDERKSIQKNLIKSLKYQYIVTLYHELNNPLNALQNIIEENLNEENQIDNDNNFIEQNIRINDIYLLINLIKIFIKNFIWYFRIIFECSNNLKIMLSSKINLEYQFNRIVSHFATLFKYKEIDYSNNFSFLSNKYIESNENYLNNFLRGVYILLYHLIPRKSGFEIKFCNLSDNKIKVNFLKSNIEKEIDRRKSKIINDIDFKFKEEFDFSKTVQTIEMTKELLINISEMLKIKLKLYDEEETLILSLIIPYSTEEEEIEEINEFTEEKKKITLEAVNRKLELSINEDSKYFDNLTSQVSKGYSSNIQSLSIQNSQNPLYNIKINGDEYKRNNNNNNNINDYHKNLENLDLVSLENDPFIKATKDKNFKTILISDSEISKDSMVPTPSIQQSKTLKNLSRKNLYHEESVNENFRFIKNGFLTVGKLNENNNWYKKENEEILNEISLSYNIKKLSHKTSTNNSKLTTRFSTFEKNIPTSNNYINSKFCNCCDVLLCDDETFNISTIKNMLKKFNIDSDISTNGRECLDAIINKKELNCKCDKKYYKLIFLDMMMPIMNGLETAKKIQRMIDDNEISNEIKIIIVSAHIEENLLKQLKNIKSIVEMVHKPLKKTKLNELLNKYYFAN